MSKSETKSCILNMNVYNLKPLLLANITSNNRFAFQQITTESNGFIIFLNSKMSMSSSGEKITVILEMLNETQSTVTIKSELKSKLQQFDSGINNKNIDQLFSIMQNAQANTIPLQENVSLAEKYLDSSNHITTFQKSSRLLKSIKCIYYGGHEKLNKECSGVVYVYSDRLEFYVFKKQFEIPIGAIIDCEIISQEQITQRVTATRMVALGVFSLATPKKLKNITNFLTVKYEELGVQSMLIFRGDDTFSFSTASDQMINLHSAILKARKELYLSK
ncbi:MAG: hypothetical protein WCN92_08180 [Eubacteriales bacterium]